MYVHIISLPDDTEVKAENADEEYIAYPQISAGDNFILALRAKVICTRGAIILMVNLVLD